MEQHMITKLKLKIQTARISTIIKKGNETHKTWRSEKILSPMLIV